MKFDIVLCCAQKDFNKVPYTVDCIQKNIQGFEKIYIISPAPIPRLNYNNINYFLDKEVLDIDATQWKFRPNWIYQQFLKLFQNVTTNTYYVTIDADVFINKPLSFFDEQGKPIWYLGRNQHHKPYFVFQKKIFGFGKVYDHSFINDMNFLSKDIIHEMLEKFGYTFESFLHKTQKIITKSCYIAEPELYGSYLVNYHPQRYLFKKIKIQYIGREQMDLGETWDETALKNEINRLKQTDNDIFMIHSWHVPPKNKAVVKKYLKGLQLKKMFIPSIFSKQKEQKCTIKINQDERDRPKKYIDKALTLLIQKHGHIIVEIGSMRLPLTHSLDDCSHPCCNDGHSSMLFAQTGLEFYSIDYDKQCVKNTKKMMKKFQYTNATVRRDDGIHFLKNFHKKIDLLYLDAWDVNHRESAQKHLEAYTVAQNNLHNKSIILIDDTDVELNDRNELVLSSSGTSGKGRLVIPQAVKDGYTIVFSGRQTMLVRQEEPLN